MTVAGVIRGPARHASSVVRAVRANPTLAAVAAEGFLTRLGFSMVGFALPLFALSLGMSLSEIGLLYALRTVTVIVVKPIMGWAADRFGARQTLVLAVFLRCVVGLLFIFASAPWHLYLIRVLHGAMTAARDPSAASLIATHGDKERMASSFAWYSTARDLGKSLGYTVAGFLIVQGDFRLVFFVAFLTSCAGLVTVLRFVKEQPVRAKVAAQVERTRHAQAAVAGPALIRLAPYLAFGFTVAGSAEMMAGLYPILATTYAHMSASAAGLAVSVSGVGILIAGPLFGWLSDRVSTRFALSARGIANAISSLLYLVFPNAAGFTVAKVMDDTGKGAFRPTWGALMADVSAEYPAARARTMSTLDTASSVGEAIGPLIASVLISAFGVPVMLMTRAALALMTEFQAARLHGGRSPGHVPETAGAVEPGFLIGEVIGGGPVRSPTVAPPAAVGAGAIVTAPTPRVRRIVSRRVLPQAGRAPGVVDA